MDKKVQAIYETELRDPERYKFNQFYCSEDCAPSISERGSCNRTDHVPTTRPPLVCHSAAGAFPQKGHELKHYHSHRDQLLLTAKHCRHKFAFAVW